MTHSGNGRKLPERAALTLAHSRASVIVRPVRTSLISSATPIRRLPSACDSLSVLDGADAGHRSRFSWTAPRFTPKSGGQIGDTGTITTDTGTATVLDTTFALPNLRRHHARVTDWHRERGTDGDGIHRCPAPRADSPQPHRDAPVALCACVTCSATTSSRLGQWSVPTGCVSISRTTTR